MKQSFLFENSLHNSKNDYFKSILLSKSTIGKYIGKFVASFKSVTQLEARTTTIGNSDFDKKYQ